MVAVACHPSGAQNFEVVSVFLEEVCTPAMGILFSFI